MIPARASVCSGSYLTRVRRFAINGVARPTKGEEIGWRRAEDGTVIQPRERTVVYYGLRSWAEPEGSAGGRSGIGDRREDRRRGTGRGFDLAGHAQAFLPPVRFPGSSRSRFARRLDDT